MKVRLSLLAFFALSAFVSFGQRYVVAAGGNWSLASTWASSSGGAGGAGVPTSTDDVYTDGLKVVVDTDAAICRNLYIERNTTDAVTLNRNLEVTGLITGWDKTNNQANIPTVNLIKSGRGILKFTGTNFTSGAYLFDYWDPVAVLPTTQIVLGTKTGAVYDALAFGKDVTIISGTLSPENEIAVTGTLTVSSGATFSLSTPLHGGSSVLKMSSLVVNGTLVTSSYVNAENVNIASGAIFRTSYQGTSGWWYGSTSPSGTVTISGNITYNANANQAVRADIYGSLTLSGSGTKTLSTGGLTINGLLSIGSNVTFNSSSASGIVLNGNISNSGSWSPSQSVKFESSGTQIMSGNPIVFGGGIEIGNAATTPATVLDLADNLDVNGNLDIHPNASLDLNDNVLSLSGNFSNNGTLTNDGSGLAQITFDGTTSVSGSAAASFPNVVVSGTFNAPSPLTISRNLTINSGGAYNAGATLNLAGNFANSGTFNGGSGTVNFNGTSGQSLSGTATFHDMTVSNANTVSAVGNINLSGTFSLSGSGKFYAGTGSNFTVLSTGINAGGSIASMGTPSNFTGQLTIQRYIDTPADWRYLSIPIKNADVSDISDDITVTGFSGESCTADGVTVYDCSAASIYEFTASSQQWTGLTGTTYATKSLSSLKGYSIWSYLTSNKTLDFTGDIEKGTVTISNLSGTSGNYSLIPNPYPSAIDWDGITNTGFSNSIYLTTSEGNHATYTKGGGGVGVNHPDGNWTGQIAMGQSFWVQSSGGSSSLQITESAKIGTYEFVREATPKDYFKMKLKSSTQSDELAIVFRSTATVGNDADFDAVKRPNDGVFNFSSWTTDNASTYAINTIPPIQCNETIKLNLADVAEGQYTIAFSHLDRMELGYEFVLVDKYLGIEKIVEAGLEYTFDITAEPQTFGSGRFEVKINSPEVDVARELGIASLLECNKDYVRVELGNSQKGIQYLFKLADQALHEPTIGDGGSVYAYISKSQLNFGSNALSLVASSLDGCNAHIFNEAITLQFDAIDEITTVTSAQSCGEGSVSLQASGASSGGFYRWYESVDAVEAIADVNGSTFVTPSLSETRSYYVTAVNANGCESSLRVPVEAKIIVNPTPELSVEGDKLTVNAKLGIQWYKDGEPIEGATLAEYAVKSSGVYNASVTKDGCIMHSETFEFIVNSEVGKSSASGYTLSPNPTHDILYVNGPSFSGVAVTIYDSKGREMNIAGSPLNENQMAFDLSSAKNGLYFINILSQRKLVQLKAIKK